MTSIDSLVKSKTYKRNSKFFLVREVQENFKTALGGAIQNGSFQWHNKKGIVCFDSVIVLLMEVVSTSWISTIHMQTIYGFSKTNTWILRSFHPNSVLTRQTSEKVAFKSGFDYLLECFLPSIFARIISVLPEKLQKVL